jgi:regulatory protein
MQEGSQAGKAKQTALRLLAMRDRSEGELRKKLKQKGYEDDLIERLLANFLELGYLNDDNYTGRQVRYLAGEKLYGDRRIEVYLTGKGLPRERIRQAIAEVRQEFPEVNALEIILKKKLKGRRLENDAGGKRRLAQSLMGKGFPLDLIYRMLEEYSHDDDGK